MRARPLTWARQGLGPSLAAWCPAPARQGTGSASARRFQRQQAAHLQAGTGLLGLLLWRGPATAATVCPPARPAARRCLPARCRRPDPLHACPPTDKTNSPCHRWPPRGCGPAAPGRAAARRALRGAQEPARQAKQCRLAGKHAAARRTDTHAARAWRAPAARGGEGELEEHPGTERAHLRPPTPPSRSLGRQ